MQNRYCLTETYQLRTIFAATITLLLLICSATGVIAQNEKTQQTTDVEPHRATTEKAIESEISTKNAALDAAVPERQKYMFFHGTINQLEHWSSSLSDTLKSEIKSKLKNITAGEDKSSLQERLFTATYDNGLTVKMLPRTTENISMLSLPRPVLALLDFAALLFILSLFAYLSNRVKAAKLIKLAQPKVCKEEELGTTSTQNHPICSNQDIVNPEESVIRTPSDDPHKSKQDESFEIGTNVSAAELKNIEQAIHDNADKILKDIETLAQSLVPPQRKLSSDLNDVKAYVNAKRKEETENAFDLSTMEMSKAVADLCESYQFWLNQLLQNLNVLGNDSRAMDWITEFFTESDYTYPCQLLKLARLVSNKEISGIRITTFEESLEQMIRGAVGPAYVLNNRLQNPKNGDRGYHFGQEEQQALKKLGNSLATVEQYLLTPPVSIRPVDMPMLKENPGFTMQQGTLTDFFPNIQELDGISSKVIDIITWGFKRNGKTIGPPERVIVT